MDDVVKRGPGRPKAVMEDDTMRDDIRVEMRHEVREEDPMEAAARATKEFLDRTGGISPDWKDDFEIPDHLKRPGWEIEWKRWSVGNKEDQSHIMALQEMGWSFVPAKRPGWNRFLPRGWKDDLVIKKEMVAMERPAEISRLVREQQLSEAIDQIKRKERQLNEAPPGTLQRHKSDGNSVGSGVKRTISGPIPN